MYRNFWKLIIKITFENFKKILFVSFLYPACRLRIRILVVTLKNPDPEAQKMTIRIRNTGYKFAAGFSSWQKSVNPMINCSHSSMAVAWYSHRMLHNMYTYIQDELNKPGLAAFWQFFFSKRNGYQYYWKLTIFRIFGFF